jgi:ubiquinone/menaquinone biosynthesis C-methylase UbiE
LPADTLRKKIDLVPPKGMIYTGAGDFVQIGDRIANRMIIECGFKPDQKVLDVGCGIGRIARPFTKYLNIQGEYYGFDVVKPGVLWCNKHYKQFSNFHFDYVPVSNDLYNDTANVNDWEFNFPYYDKYFDLVASISVFAHMQQKGVQNYFREIARVLKTGKNCFATFFIMNAERKLNFENGRSFFKYKEGQQYLHDRYVKDANVAYDYTLIEKFATTAGLIITKFLPGWWNEGVPGDQCDFQDVIIMQKI